VARTKRHLSSLTSAAARIFRPAQERPPASGSAEDLYSLYTELGQIRAALEFKSMAASKVQYFPAQKSDPRGDPEPVESGPALDAFDALEGIQGEFADFVAELCIHLDVAGEAYLVGWDEDTDPEVRLAAGTVDEWDIVSPVEYNQARQSGYTPRDPTAIRVITDSDFVLRIWRPHPMMRQLPNSSLRSVKTEAEQYVLLRGMVSAIAASRLIMGVMKVPEGLSFAPKANGEPADDFFEVFLEAAEAAVRDPASAARVVPIFVQGDGEILEQLDMLDMARDLPEWVPALMERVLRQIATGLDLPADILLGLADVNHWTAWLSEDSAKLDYVDPLVLLILDSLTRGYLQPYLREAGVPDPETYLFWRDYSDLIARSVGSADATALYDRGIISADAVRRTVGFTEADAPEEGDLPVAAEVLEFPAGPSEVLRGPPGLVAAGAVPGLGDIDSRVYTQLSEASQAALDRALERAGAKIRRYVQGQTSRIGGSPRPARDPIMAAAIDGRPNRQVGQILGPVVREAFQLTDDDLIPPDSFTGLGARVDQILRKGQDDTYAAVSRSTGTEPARNLDEETSWREEAVAILIAALTALAIRRLFTPDMGPDPAETGEVPDTSVPPADVFAAMTIAGGSQPGTGPEVPRGLANGALAQTWIIQAGYSIRERIWTVGAPAVPFEPHQALRGTTFTEWTDPALRTPVTASWLGTSYMFPGDHRGCQCVAELVVDEPVDLFPPLAASAASR
jgi:hypothetical protein